MDASIHGPSRLGPSMHLGSVTLLEKTPSEVELGGPMCQERSHQIIGVGRLTSPTWPLWIQS